MSFVQFSVFDALKRREDANGLIQLDHKPQFSPGRFVFSRGFAGLFGAL